MSNLHRNEKPLIINNIYYKSLREAARKLNVDHATVTKWKKTLDKSARSEMDFIARMPKKFTVRKVKNES